MSDELSASEENSEYYWRTYIWTSQCWYCQSDIKLAYSLVEVDNFGKYDRGLNSHIPSIDTINKIGDKELKFELRFDIITDSSGYDCVCPQCDKGTNKNDIREELFNIFFIERSKLIHWKRDNMKHQEQISRKQAYAGVRFS